MFAWLSDGRRMVRSAIAVRFSGVDIMVVVLRSQYSAELMQICVKCSL